jgi:hypothetical protein
MEALQCGPLSQKRERPTLEQYVDLYFFESRRRLWLGIRRGAGQGFSSAG